jgi:hypothetical protein
MEEVREFVKAAKEASIGSLYLRTKQYVKEYNDQDGSKIILIALDIVSSYFQDKFSTTHYIGVVGDNDSGKSSLGITFEATAYRPLYMTDPSAANIFRCLGTIEPGQCTIILDEADKIDKSPEMMAILKTGYQLNGKVPKINTNTLRQEFFFTYCLKIIIGERSMSLTQAKGVHDRTFSLTAYAGDSVFDIKETLNPQGNPTCNKRWNDLLSFRKLLLIYRLIHYDDPPVDIETDLKRRNRELVKPLLQLFHSVEPKVRHEIKSTLENFLKAKQGKKENTLEAVLCPIIKELVLKNNRILASDIWGIIKEGNRIRGHYDDGRPNEFQTEDFGTIYQNTLTTLICDKFGAVKKHTEKGSVLIFDQEKFLKVSESYALETKIQLTWDYPDGPDGPDGSRGTPNSSEENLDAEITGGEHHLSDISDKDPNNDVNITTGKNENQRTSPVEPSEPSEPSANLNGNEDESKCIEVTSKSVNTTNAILHIPHEAAHENTDMSNEIDNNPILPAYVYRLGHSDRFGCKYCIIRDDKWGMTKHYHPEVEGSKQ